MSVAELAQQQQAMLTALLGNRPGDADALAANFPQEGARLALARRGLVAYRSHGLALAERALAGAFPVLQQLLGDENFAPLARQFWRSHPPADGDMAVWGKALAAFIETAPQLAGEPFLGDVARVEWALHRAATAADAALQPVSFELLTRVEPDRIALCLAPGTALVLSAWPVASLVQAHGGTPDSADLPDRAERLAQAAELLQTRTAECACIWRHGFKPRVAAIDAGECALLTELLAGQSLAAALDRAAAAGWAEARFGEWLGVSVQNGLVTGACELPRMISKQLPIDHSMN
jgi:hypothetical protein